MDTELMLDVGQANEFKLAARRAGYTNADIKRICEGDVLAKLLPVVRGKSEVVIQRIMRLALRDPISLPVRSAGDPVAFYQTRAGFYVWEGFTNRILSVASKVELPATTIQSLDLVKDASDAEIRAELPVNHVWDASAFCAHLAGMIVRQPHGKAGDFLTNGYASIFYVCGINGEVFSVRVRWLSDDRWWVVSAYPLGGDRGRAGDRVFSATALVA